MDDYQPTFQWQPDPGWELGDQMHFGKQLQVGRIVAGDLTRYFQSSWPQMWQEGAQTWGTTAQEVREAVRAYGRWLTAVADHDAALMAADDEPSDADDTDGM